MNLKIPPLSVLDFNFLDDLALASTRGRADPRVHLQGKIVRYIGPLFELLALHRAGVLPINALPTCQIYCALNQALNSEEPVKGTYVEMVDTRNGFVVTARDPNTNDQVHWTVFCRKAQEAAELSLPKPVAQGLIGAMREIEENVHIHSYRDHDGIVGFRGAPGEFEFAVLDSGIGVLESLRQSPDYQHLKDSGTAIKVALTDGQSSLRYQDPGRGYGFHDLFVGLANLNGDLRFRSGDHALTIDGTSPAVVASRLSQKVTVPGFLVSIQCRLKPVHMVQ